MADRLSLYNGALMLLGERTLASLTDNVEPRRLLDIAWTDAVDQCLEAGMWRFATRTVQLAPITSVEPDFGYRLAYEKPVDMVRTKGVWVDEYSRLPLLQYRFERNYWFTDAEPIYVSYVSNDVAYGGNIGEWPVDFVRYVEAYLASRIVISLKQDLDAEQRLIGLMRLRLRDAASTDAMEGPTEFLPEGSWVVARYGRNAGRRDRGGRGRLIG